jgi:multisubunit Na+/H+ antiporter MnhE subunit
MKALALNLVIATIWLLLGKPPQTSDFVIGFLLGYGLIALFHALIPGGRAYIRRTLAFIRFAGLFTWQLIAANFSVAAAVLFRSRRSLAPNYVTYDISGLRPAEILLLSYCITLTPGTVSIRVTDDERTLIVHALDAADPAAIRAALDKELKQPILAFTR